MIDVMIYSKNRAMQLDLLLRSIKRNFFNVGKVFVLNDYDDVLHSNTYKKIWSKDYGLNTEFVKQDRPTFYNVVINAIQSMSSGHILPLCDDDVFIRETDVKDDLCQIDDNTVGICFRRAPGLKESYHSGGAVKEPGFAKAGRLNKWKWHGEDPLRWGYPYQAGGMVYNRMFFLHMMNNITFDIPNYLESGMMGNKDVWGKDYVLCLDHTPIVNISINRVQTVCNNRGGRDKNYSPDELASLFLNGKVIDDNIIQGMNNTCEFVEISLGFKEGL